jgi:hypothetical protein
MEVVAVMSRPYLEAGIYLNLFEVKVPNLYVTIFTAPASNFPNLCDLRSYIAQENLGVRLYQSGARVFAYGKDAHQLASQGFQQQMVYLFDYPKWCTRLITEGLNDHLKERGYRQGHGKGRVTLYEPQPYGNVANGELKVFRGYDLRVIHLYQQSRLIFGLIVDICWEVQDVNGKRINMEGIAQKYNAVLEVAKIQEEILPNNQINPEVSKLRLQDHILPFVISNREFVLPLGQDVKVTLEEIPVQIILGESL